MTKTTAKANNAARSVPLIVLGYDEKQKPVGAQFAGADAAQVTKAAEAMDLKVYEAATEDLATGDMFTLRFRDYPKLPKFVRHRAAIALMSPPAE
jgi:hypothetical protein